MGGNRDSFPQFVRTLVAGEVHYQCSYRDCGAPTIGPSAEPGKLTNVGVAAHITAASPGGPRYDAGLTPAQRSGAENAIWMCQTHAKAVDDDTSTHSVELLCEWKRAALARADRALKAGTIDPDGRRRLALESEQALARKVFRTIVQGRGAIVRGVAIAEQLSISRVGSDEQQAAVNSTAEWLVRLDASIAAIDDVLLDVRVQWGAEAEAGDPLVKLYVWSNTWRNWFSENSLIQMGVKTHHTRACDEPWNWDAVFRGDPEHRRVLVSALDAVVDLVEAWAAPLISGRNPQ